MKKPILTILLLVAIPTLSRATDEAIAPAITADLHYLARLLAPVNLARGMSPKDVEDRLGAPAAKLAPNVWVYWHFKAKDTPRGDQYDTALVIFANSRVERVKLCDGKAVRAFLAQQEVRTANAAKGLLAAK